MSAPGRSRAAAVALLAGVVVLAGASLVVPAAMLWTRQGAEIRAERSKILEADERERARSKLMRTTEAWTGFAQNEKAGFLSSQSDEMAISAARKRIEDAFDSVGGKARQFAAEAEPAGRNGVSKIAFEMRGTIPRKRLASLLAALESQTPYVIVESFDATVDSSDTLALSIGAGMYRLERTGL